MNRYVFLLFFGVLTSGTSDAADGIIRFTGSIVEDVCSIATGPNSMTSSCFRDSEMLNTTKTLTTTQAANYTLPQNIGVVKTTRIKGHSNLAIIHVTYN